MRLLVFGGTGTVGSQVVSGLTAKNVEVRVATRNPENARNLPSGATPVIADMMKPKTLAPAMQGIDAVFLLNALSQTEVEEGINAIRAMTNAGVNRVVYLSIHDVHKAPHIPHFKTKIDIEAEIKSNALDYTLIAPNNFYQNDYWWAEPIAKYGMYPQPIGNVGTSRVDVRDIGEAAVNALTMPGHVGQTYPLVGPEAVTGESTAETYSRLFGTKISYAGDDLDAFAERQKPYMPHWLIEDLKIMYDYFQKHGLKASDADVAQQQKILGHPPRSFGDFAQEFASSTKSQAKSA